MRYFLIFLFTFFLLKTGFAQEGQKTEADSVIYAELNPPPEGSHVDSIFVNFSGVWHSGFEENELKPCGNWVPDSLGDTAFIPNNIGISTSVKSFDFIKSKRDSLSLPSNRTGKSKFELDLFIKGRGWLIGPGNFHHFGMKHYTIKTVSFSKIRWAKPNECE